MLPLDQPFSSASVCTAHQTIKIQVDREAESQAYFSLFYSYQKERKALNVINSVVLLWQKGSHRYNIAIIIAMQQERSHTGANKRA